MKRGLLGLFALTLAFGFACSPQPATNSNGRGSTDAGLNVAACDRPPIVYSIVISVGTKAMKGTHYLAVAPYEVAISVKCKDQIRWIVSNSFNNVELKDIEITKFKRLMAPYNDPFGSGSSKFEVKYVGPQRIGDVLSSIGVNYGEYEYEVSGKVTLGGSTTPVTMDPRVVVGD